MWDNWSWWLLLYGNLASLSVAISVRAFFCEEYPNTPLHVRLPQRYWVSLCLLVYLLWPVWVLINLYQLAAACWKATSEKRKLRHDSNRARNSDGAG